MIDSSDWHKKVEDFDDLNNQERDELATALKQASGCLFVRIWEEVSKLFLDYLKKSKSSPYKNVFAIFARKEYQKDKGNLSHTHLMLKINWEKHLLKKKSF